jgi:hypothetical protein
MKNSRLYAALGGEAAQEIKPIVQGPRAYPEDLLALLPRGAADPENLLERGFQALSGFTGIPAVGVSVGAWSIGSIPPCRSCSSS